LEPEGDLYGSNITEATIFKETLNLLRKKLKPLDKDNYEAAIDSNPTLYQGMLQENYTKVLGSHPQNTIDDIANFADHLSDSDLFTTQWDPDYVVDRVGSEISSTHTVMIAQTLTDAPTGQFDIKFTTGPAWNQAITKAKRQKNGPLEKKTVAGQSFSATGFGKQLDQRSQSKRQRA
jgi:hypothetical protein